MVIIGELLWFLFMVIVFSLLFCVANIVVVLCKLFFSRFYLVSFFHFDRQVSFLRIRFELIISETIPHTVQRVGMTTRRRTQRQIDCWAFFCGLEQFQLVYCGQWSRKVRTKRNFVQCCFVQITLIGKSCPVVYESRLVLLCKGPRCCRWFGALIVD